MTRDITVKFSMARWFKPASLLIIGYARLTGNAPMARDALVRLVERAVRVK